jgi:carotenoid cleavage dioxygenase
LRRAVGAVTVQRSSYRIIMEAPVDHPLPANSLPITRRNVRPVAPDGTPPPDAPDWIWDLDHPYLHGAFAPTHREYAAEKLELIAGEIPRDLYGAYVLNGPSQRFTPVNKYHYYDGDAMLRAVWFRDGEARFAQRWIRNEAFVVEDMAGRSIWPGIAGPYDHRLPGSPIKDVSNTDVIFYAGKLLSLWHMAGIPYDIDPLTLETKGKETLGGLLRHSLSAHSKTDPLTGELYFFTYGDEAPYMRYGVADPAGRLIHDVPIEIPGPRSPHDLGLTEHYAILHDLPFFHDVEVLRKHGKRALSFHRDMPARFGVIPRFGTSDQVRWFEAEPCYILHIVNCWEEGEWVHQVGFRQPDPAYVRDAKDGPLASMLAQRRRLHRLHRWSFNMATGETREQQLDDDNTEFPTVNANYLGRPSRIAFAQRIPLPVAGDTTGQCQTFDGLVRYDLATGAVQRWDYGPGVHGNEAPVAPRRGAGPDAPEEEAYAITFTTDTNDWHSECQIFSAADISRGPVARLRVPHRISLGFHSTWVPGEALPW